VTQVAYQLVALNQLEVQMQVQLEVDQVQLALLEELDQELLKPMVMVLLQVMEQELELVIIMELQPLLTVAHRLDQQVMDLLVALVKVLEMVPMEVDNQEHQVQVPLTPMEMLMLQAMEVEAQAPPQVVQLHQAMEEQLLHQVETVMHQVLDQVQVQVEQAQAAQAQVEVEVV